MKDTNTSGNSIVKRFHILWIIIVASIFAGNVYAGPKSKAAKTNKVAKVTKLKSSKVVMKKVALPAKATKQVAATRAPVQRGPSSLSAGISDSQKSLEIRGQSRNLSMLLVLKNRHENIDFVKPRESYREEIPQTEF